MSNSELVTLNEIKCVQNHLYLYGEIEYENILELNSFLYLLTIADDIPDIYLHLCTNGGELQTAFSTTDTILKLREIKPIYTVIEGHCYSAGTIISIVGTKRYITPNSTILIHELLAEISGNASQIEHETMNNTLLMNKMKDLYKTYTKLTNKRLNKFFQSNLFLDSKKALEYGIVDEEVNVDIYT